MRRILLLSFLACALFAAPVNRGLVAAVEVSMNKRIEALLCGGGGAGGGANTSAVTNRGCGGGGFGGAQI